MEQKDKMAEQEERNQELRADLSLARQKLEKLFLTTEQDENFQEVLRILNFILNHAILLPTVVEKVEGPTVYARRPQPTDIRFF